MKYLWQMLLAQQAFAKMQIEQATAPYALLASTTV
jgi:hypothetical protein